MPGPWGMVDQERELPERDPEEAPDDVRQRFPGEDEPTQPLEAPVPDEETE